jgi:hypothetical protein
MEQVFDAALLTSVRTHAGCPVPESALEVVWKESEKVAKQRGTPLEFVLAERVKRYGRKLINDDSTSPASR